MNRDFQPIQNRKPSARLIDRGVPRELAEILKPQGLLFQLSQKLLKNLAPAFSRSLPYSRERPQPMKRQPVFHAFQIIQESPGAPPKNVGFISHDTTNSSISCVRKCPQACTVRKSRTCLYGVIKMERALQRLPIEPMGKQNGFCLGMFVDVHSAPHRTRHTEAEGIIYIPKLTRIVSTPGQELLACEFPTSVLIKAFVFISRDSSF